MTKKLIPISMLAFMLATPSTAQAQELGKGGLGVDNAASLPKCDKPMATIALVEKKAADPYDKLPEGIRALAELAEAQDRKEGPTRVDPVPLVRLMAANSGCFIVADRGDSFEAVKRERALSGLGELPVTPADYIANVELLYADTNARGGGGGVGGLGYAIGIKTKHLEAQMLISLVDVKTGLQTSIASGSARKKDLSIIGGGILVDAGVALLGGAYNSTDLGKITALATLDAFRALIPATQSAMAAAAPVAPEQPK
ncbi:CsgG/HfaB family protein [uncultured Sphingorhabdus sp.]|uniref:CsgG/HfaB family protein n=1 Tax=uncultured Sphingorhabdus sp. TaxID=1686106 RepID=UPI0026020363|nr:CsgG/HfaB family protein [uncultured Sphingorhabdus sp.]HMS20510.1 CsgG/HfaB family protein [Sphingorhabdus sp.]